MAVSLFKACSSPEQKFYNTGMTSSGGAANLWEIARMYLRTKREAPTPASPLPLRPIPAAELAEPGNHAKIYRLGHSSTLIHLDGNTLLTDPVFSERASPVQWAGPKRFHPLPFSLADLPAITAVVISHDHYDHLDRDSVLALDHKVSTFLVPLKVGNHLRRWGIADDKIVELDWWQSHHIGSLQFTATPAQHFSGRSLGDRDNTLWASWAIQGQGGNIFFSGDSGYFDGFREIGERLGPFDLTLIETGAYNLLWRKIHMLPEQSVQAHMDLRGRAMLPIHNSTFDLALHDWFEPLERATAAAQKNNIHLLTPIIGAPVMVKQPRQTPPWWRDTTEPASLEAATAAAASDMAALKGQQP
ncbi:MULTISPECIES: MBL fold metallo-hydrolase [unclassified Alcanivorax]|uniref:MBL fold metallo-hydrolase n=1 Tax=unclassified Alcanivorax TaxID=2638842 RepID=UPI0002DF2A75|nr:MULTISPECIES: MBL fold metallo-hydrolase [unclassified Alcanivorax]